MLSLWMSVVLQSANKELLFLINVIWQTVKAMKAPNNVGESSQHLHSTYSDWAFGAGVRERKGDHSSTPLLPQTTDTHLQIHTQIFFKSNYWCPLRWPATARSQPSSAFAFREPHLFWVDFFLWHAPSCGTLNIKYKTRLPGDFGPWRDQTTEWREKDWRDGEVKGEKKRVRENIGNLFQMTAGSPLSPWSLHVLSLVPFNSAHRPFRVIMDPCPAWL